MSTAGQSEPVGSTSDRGSDRPLERPLDVVVVGSANVDYVVRVGRRPAVGETVAGEDLVVLPGGKGANQAVAAARSGARVGFVGAVGTDVHAATLVDALVADGIDVSAVQRHPGPSGSAVIVVGPEGDNSIIIIAGANGAVDAAGLSAAEANIGSAAVCVLQGELSPEATDRAAQIAHEAGVRVVLNLAPIIAVDAQTLAVADPLVVNSHEAGLLLGLSGEQVEADPVGALERLHDLGPRSAVITLGSEGSVLLAGGITHVVPPVQVQVVDSTGAGDAFVGALAAGLARGESLSAASGEASVFAGLAVTRRGAQAAYPTRAEAQEKAQELVSKSPAASRHIQQK